MGNVVGLIGVFLLLASYLLLIRGHWKPIDLAYPVTNTVASLCILFSLLTDFNLPAFIAEVLFLSIGLYGIYKSINPTEATER